jgi:hypothetical protein
VTTSIGRFRRTIITIVVVAALTGGVIWWTSSVFRQPVFTSGVSVILRNLNSHIDVAAGQIAANESIGQTFRATRANLSRVDVRLATYGGTNEAPVVLTLVQYPSLETIRAAVAAPGSVLDGAFHTFSFRPVPDSAGTRFLITLMSPKAPSGNPLSSWVGNCDCYGGGVAFLNGEPQFELDIALRIGYRNQTTDVTGELLGRMSQYKPGFLKGEALVILTGLSLVLTIAAVGYFAFSLMDGEAPSS